MKRKMTLLLALMLVVLMAPLGLAQATEVSPVKYVIPGDAPSGYDYVMPLVNEKLKEIGIELSVQYIPWDVWDQKLNLMLSTGEAFDLFHVMQDRVSFSSYYSRGGLMDITPYLEEYGEAIFKAIPENIMEAAKIQGKYYAVPTNWIELGVEGLYTVRMDLLEKYGQKLPTTNAEILDVVENIINQHDGVETLYLPFRGGSIDPTSTHTNVLHAEYDRFPFTVKDSLFFVAQDGTVESWVETEEFKKDCEWMHEAYTRGLIDPDVLSITHEQISDLTGRGIFVFGFGTMGSYTGYLEEWPDITPESVIVTRLHPEKGVLRPWAFKNGNSVPSSAKNPEGAIKFINWLYSSQENYDLFIYGVDGVNYTVPEERRITNVDMESTDPQRWAFADWMIGNMEFIRTSTGGFPSIDNARYTVDPTAENSIAGGFFFDPSPVQTEYSNVMTELAAVMVPIVLGVQAYDDAYPAALESLKKAGLDKVVAEYKAQFEAYRESVE